MEETWTTLSVLDWTTAHFGAKGMDSPRLDAQVLLAHVLQCDRIALYTHFDQPLADEERARYRDLVMRRAKGEPVAYLVGHREFYSRNFDVDPRVLIPRPDSETLIEEALAVLKDDKKPNIADIATGSGVLAVTLLLERPSASAVASDVSSEALSVAAQNSERHAVTSRLELRCGDMLKVFTSGEAFDLIVSNPPYIPGADIATLSQEVQNEPRLALDGGVDGLDFIRRLIAGAPNLLSKNGVLLIEHGFDQGDQVRQIALAAGAEGVELIRDLAGHGRVTKMRFDTL